MKNTYRPTTSQEQLQVLRRAMEAGMKISSSELRLLVQLTKAGK